jgi:hypothetical protein
MLFSNNRDELREHYFKTWRKYQNNQPLEALEEQIITVLLEHPEYQAIIENQEAYRSHDFTEMNPFLHFALHIALRDQITLNQPDGITAVFQQLTQKCPAHEAEHCMMEVLAYTIFDLMKNNTPFNSAVYLDEMKKL